MKRMGNKTAERIIHSIIPAIILVVLPRTAVFFASDIAGIINDTAKEVLSAWKTAEVIIPFYIPLLSFAVWYTGLSVYDKIRPAHKCAKAVFTVLAVFGLTAGFIITLLLTKVNAIPLHTVLKVVIGLL